MQSFYTILRQFNYNLMKGIPYRIQTLASQIAMPKSGFPPQFSTLSDDPKLKELLDYLENLKNYEKSGVPKDAGTDSEEGFDLGRMRRLMERLGNPHANFHAVHIAGTKGKGSTAAFLSNILRDAGYSVGCYTSPHLHTIRERISIGGKGDPITAEALMDLFYRVKKVLDQSIELENGSLSHFEVFTAMAFTLFDKENVDIAVVEAGLGGARDATNVLSGSRVATSVITTIGEEHLAALGGSLESIAMAKSGIIKHGRPLVMGGPFKPHIEYILRHKASLMCSPVVSASDPGIQRVIRGICRVHDKLYQSCDIIIRVEKDLKLFIELKDLRLQMLGSHQLQNAVTATCVALCLREQGWAVSDESIRAGLEQAYLLGRSQILTEKEAEVIGLSGGASLLIDGAHTEASAKSLADTVRMMHPNEPLALVVAMASDKDHVAFARQLLSGMQPQVVLLTEVSIAGGKSRMSSASSLKEAWVQAATELGIGFLDIGMRGHKRPGRDHIFSSTGFTNYKTLFATAPEMETVKDSILVANELMRSRAEQQSGVIVVTGSLHLVSAVLTVCTGNILSPLRS